VSIEYRGERFAGYNKPKRTPGAKKSHAVLAKSGSEVKLIRFVQGSSCSEYCEGEDVCRVLGGSGEMVTC